jgi:6-methylsalicylate decarboxylase
MQILAYLDRAGISMQIAQCHTQGPGRAESLERLRRRSSSRGTPRVSDCWLHCLPMTLKRALRRSSAPKTELHADGFAAMCQYNDVYLGDPSLEPVMEELDRQGAVGFMHPDAYKPAVQGRPVPLIEVAFETARTLVNMLYAGTFRRYPNIKFHRVAWRSCVAAACG